MQRARKPNHDPAMPIANLVAIYSRQLEDRRAKLEENLSYFQGKLQELEKIDPLDFIGLQRLYRRHLTHTGDLLAMLENTAPAENL